MMEKIINIDGKAHLDEVIKTEGKIVLVDFWASWCGPCRMLIPVLEKIVSEEENLILAKVNVDEEQNQVLAQEYDVNGIPHVCIFKGGEQVDQFAGAIPYEPIKEMVGKYL